MDTLERLVAIEDIKALKARYCRFVDYKEWDKFELLFVHDATFEAPEDGLALVAGAREFTEHARASHEGCVAIHQCHTPDLQILASDSATGVWAMQDTLRWEEGAVTAHGYKQIIGWGYYHETYRKIGNDWRIATLKLTRLRLDFLKQDGGVRRPLQSGQRAIWS
jgi:hypothetical protein